MLFLFFFIKLKCWYIEDSRAVINILFEIGDASAINYLYQYLLFYACHIYCLLSVLETGPSSVALCVFSQYGITSAREVMICIMQVYSLSVGEHYKKPEQN